MWSVRGVALAGLILSGCSQSETSDLVSVQSTSETAGTPRTEAVHESVGTTSDGPPTTPGAPVAEEPPPASAGAAGTAPPDPEPSLEDLDEAFEVTVARARTSYEMEVVQTFGPGPESVVQRVVGAFDDDTFEGVGTRQFVTDDPSFTDTLPSEPFEFRLDESTLWLYNTVADPPGWTGVDVVEFGEQLGGSPLGVMDGDGPLEAIRASIVGVADIASTDDGGEVWSVLVRADDLLPVVAGAGPASRIAQAGAADTGIESIALITVGTDGMIASITIEMDAWWSNALETVGADPPEGSSMFVELTFEEFAETLEVSAPCEDTTETVSEDGLSILTCT